MDLHRPPAAAGAGSRLPARPVTITPAFEPEGLPNRFEEGQPPPAAMTTVGGGDTWVTSLAYSPDGSQLAVGDRPTRPLCTFLGEAPVNENGGLDPHRRRRIATGHPDDPSREVTATRVRDLEPGLHAGWPDPGRPREGGLAQGGGRSEVGYHVTAWETATGRDCGGSTRRSWTTGSFPTFSRDASTFAARDASGIRVWDIATGRERPAPMEAPARPGVRSLLPGREDSRRGRCERGSRPLGGRVGAAHCTIPGASQGRERVRGQVPHVLAGRPDSGLRRPVQRPGSAITGNTPPRSGSSTWRRSRSGRRSRASTRHVIDSAAFSPDGKSIAAVAERAVGRGRLPSWSREDLGHGHGQERASATPSRPATCVAYSAEGSLLVTADREWIVLRDPADGA